MASKPDSTVELLLSVSSPQSPADDRIPERRVTLSRQNDTITIGRASRSTSKGFVAAADNAWFDSAVMSRMHARITADMDQKKVEIKDLNSLHGTFVNGDNKVSSEKPRDLKDGDVLRFGAPIWRTNEQFLPTTVKVGINFAANCANFSTGTFQVPDVSDEEDSDDAPLVSTRRRCTKPTMPRPDGQKHHILGPAVSVIDLTSNHGGEDTRHFIDLSDSPCHSPIRVDDEELSSEVSEPNRHELETTTAAKSCQQDTTRVAASKQVQDLDPLGFVLEINVPHVEPSAEEEEGVASNKAEHAEDSDIHTEYSEEDDEEYEEEAMEEEFDDDEEEEDDDEGEPASEDWDETDSEEDEFSSDDDSLAVGASDEPHDLWSDPPQPAQATEFPEVARLVDSLSRPFAPSVAPNEPASRSTAPVSIRGLLNIEEPSSAGLGSSQSLMYGNPAATMYGGLYSYGPAPYTAPTAPTCNPPERSTAEILGDRTGKAEFFLAREQNKMTMADHPHPVSSVHNLCNTSEPSTYDFDSLRIQQALQLSRCQVPFEKYPAMVPPPVTYHLPGSLSTQAPPAAPANVSVDRDDEVDVCVNPDDEEPSAMPSPESLHEEFSRRTHVGIPDIIEARQQTPVQKKRKAEDISISTEEQEAWAAEAAKADNATPTSLAAPDEMEAPLEEDVAMRDSSPELQATEEARPLENSQQEVQVQQHDEDEDPTVMAPPTPPPERPAKKARVMNVAERLGYAALGGFTAGAMIFGTLIYTAPTFG